MRKENKKNKKYDLDKQAIFIILLLIFLLVILIVGVSYRLFSPTNNKNGDDYEYLYNIGSFSKVYKECDGDVCTYRYCKGEACTYVICNEKKNTCSYKICNGSKCRACNNTNKCSDNFCNGSSCTDVSCKGRKCTIKNCEGTKCTTSVCEKDKCIEYDENGKCILNCDDDGDGKCDRNCDTDGDGKCDINCDDNGDGKCDRNCDDDGDGKCDRKCAEDCKLNCDDNGDGKCDRNCDTNGDGKCDRNCDDNGDGKCDRNCDTDGDGKCNLNCDDDGDGKCDHNCDKDGDGKCDKNCDNPDDENPFKNGSVTIVYTEGSNKIALTNALPIEDSVGMVLTNPNEYMDFTVSVNIKNKSSDVSYEVVAEKDDKSTIDSKYIKLYLERSEDTSYSYKVLAPTIYKGINKADSYGAKKGMMVLDKVTTNKSVVYHYRLRMWLDKSYNTDSKNKKFALRVNVYGKAVNNYKD